MPGRPKPTAVKKLQGTLYKTRLNTQEPSDLIDASQMEPPDYLSEKAKEMWRFSVMQLPKNMLATLDWSAFAAWADTQGKIVEIEEILQREGLTYVNEKTGVTYAHPLLKEQDQLKNLLRGYITELGFSPSSRARVHTFGGKKTGEENGFDEL